jgi:hypothetical protein
MSKLIVLLFVLGIVFVAASCLATAPATALPSLPLLQGFKVFASVLF